MRMRSRVQRDERGAVLIMVGVFSMVMVVMTAFVVDIGNQRQNRMQLTTATDASALDVAQEWANADLKGDGAGFASLGSGKWDCSAVAQTVVRANNDGVDPDTVSCVAEEKYPDWGIVTVAASEAVEYQFGQAAGQADGNSRATTSVKVTGAAQGGLRPFAVCANLPAIKDFIDGVTGPGDDVQVDAVKHLTPQCGSASGNWGLLDLDGNGAKAVGGLFANGYSKSVKKSGNAEICVPTDPESCFTASPGAKWNSGPIKTALDFLAGPTGCEVGGPEFSVPTYERVLDPNGKNAKFPLTGFLRVQLMCFTTGGSNLNSLTLRLVSYEPDECCSGVSATNRILEICDVGTIGGVLGPDFASSCGTVTAPPAVGDGCGIHPVSPDARDVLVNDAGKAVSTTQIDVISDDPSKCGDIRLRADIQGEDRSVSAFAPTLVGNTYQFTFAAGTDFGPGGTFSTLVVYEDDFVWDQGASMRTVLDAGTPDPEDTCEMNWISPASIVADVHHSSQKLNEDLSWTADFTWPSDCGKITVAMVADNGDDSITVMPATDVSATMTFKLDKNTKLPGNKDEDRWYVRVMHGTNELFDDYSVVTG